MDMNNNREKPAFANEMIATCELNQIGAIIKECRKKQGLTQQQLADKAAVKRSFISRLERNAGSMRLSTLIKIVEKGFDGKLEIKIIC